ELVDHRVDRVLQLEDLAVDVDGDLLGQVALGDGGGDLGDVPDLVGEVRRHEVDVVGEVLPGPAHATDVGLTAELALRPDLIGSSRTLRSSGLELVDHRVDRVLQLEDLAVDVDRDLLRQVALRDRRGDVGDIANLVGQVRGHEVDAVGQVLPGSGH